jgi:fibronectin type III domain protein/putative metal-binding protein
LRNCKKICYLFLKKYLLTSNHYIWVLYSNFLDKVGLMRLFKILMGIGTVLLAFSFVQSPQAAGVSVDAPSNFLAKAKAATQIVICWKESSDNETGFIVEQKTGSCDSSNSWEQIADLPANSLRYTVTSLLPDTTYSFRVYAYNASTDSDYSNCASDTTTAAGTPPAPTNLKAESESSDVINLSWTAIATNEDGFEIWRKAGSDSWEFLATTGPDITSFKDSTANGNTSSTSYRYFVFAYNNSGDSPKTYPVIVPFQPQDLSVTTITESGKVKIMWTETASEKNGFEIWRKYGLCSSTATFKLEGKVGGNSEFWYDAGVASGGKYSYKVRGYKRTGNMLAAYGYSGFSDCESSETSPIDDYDDDGDGYSVNEGDCDDNNKNINPGELEICDDEADNDCDGYINCDDESCSDDSMCQLFNSINFDTIMEEEINLSMEKIDGSNNSNNEIPVGTVVLYETNDGRYGKFQILYYGYSLGIRWATYNQNGSIFSSGNYLTIKGTWHYDLDYGLEIHHEDDQFPSVDFKWEQVDGIIRYIAPKHGAKFAIYAE